jgi:type II secretory pathway pseudopilin PulG
MTTGHPKAHSEPGTSAPTVPHDPGSGPRVCRKRFAVGREEGVASFELMLVALVVGLLVVIAMPALLRTSPSADNIDAQANLRNALVEARSAYFPTQSYSFKGLPLSTLSFAAAAPAFLWTTGSCSSSGPDCVSEQVVDVNMTGDSQGVVLATWSSITKTCWFAVDLESVPKPLGSDRAGVTFDSVIGSAASLPGTYFGRSATGATSCVASSAVGGSAHSGWNQNLTSAGLVG